MNMLSAKHKRSQKLSTNKLDTKTHGTGLSRKLWEVSDIMAFLDLELRLRSVTLTKKRA